MFGLGMHIFFPTFILEVDTATNCHLQYEPIGRSTCLPNLHYVQPKRVMDKLSSATAATIQPTPPPTTIAPDNDLGCQPTFAPHWPKCPLSPRHPPLDMSLFPPLLYTLSLKDLDREELIQQLYTVESQQDQTTQQAMKGKSTAPMECMSTENIVSILHHPDMSLRFALVVPPTHLILNLSSQPKNYIT